MGLAFKLRDPENTARRRGSSAGHQRWRFCPRARSGRQPWRPPHTAVQRISRTVRSTGKRCLHPAGLDPWRGPSRVRPGLRWIADDRACRRTQGIIADRRNRAASAAPPARVRPAPMRGFFRKQFNRALIGSSRACRCPLAEICANAYLIDAARRLTVVGARLRDNKRSRDPRRS